MIKMENENENKEEEVNETVQGNLPDEVLALATAIVNAVKQTMDNGDMTNPDDSVRDIVAEIAQNVIDNHDWNEVFMNNVDLDDAISNADLSDVVSSVIDDVDWSYQYNLLTGDEVGDHIDIWDWESDIISMVESSVSGNADNVAEQVMEWIDEGCSSVDDYCAKIIKRGTGEGKNNVPDTVILESSEYERIMKAVTRLEEIGIVQAETKHITPEEMVARAIELSSNPTALLINAGLALNDTTEGDSE